MSASNRSVLKKILTIITVVGVIISILIALAVAAVIGLFHGHGRELNRLTTETTALLAGLDTSKVSVLKQDCHDVELRNECYMTLASRTSIEQEKAYMTEYLGRYGFNEQDGIFSKSSGDGKHKLVAEYDDNVLKTYYL